MDNGGPAFPTSDSRWQSERTGDSGGESPQDGMTLRDYFAAKAMAAYTSKQLEPEMDFDDMQIARWSYGIADAMLAEREKSHA